MRKQLNLAMKTLFTKMERYLLRNNQVFVLNTSTEERSSSSTNERHQRDLINHYTKENSAYFSTLLKGARREGNRTKADILIDEGNQFEFSSQSASVFSSSQSALGSPN